MLVTILKWALPVIAVVATASFLTTKTFLVEAVIPAPARDIWDVLMDTQSYPEWNPTFVEVDGDYAEGAKVQNKVRDPSGKILEMTATVHSLAPNRELRQTGGMPGIITFDHRWILEPVEGGTKVTQQEVDRGAGLWFWNSDWIEPAYSRATEALAARVLANSSQ